MIDSKYRISLDVNSTTSNVRLKCKRGDTGRTIYAALTESGYPYHITDDCYAVFTATKPDGKKVYNGCKIEGCAIVYELTPQTVAVPGLVKCEIKLYGADDKLITSASFLLEVCNAQVNDGDELESETEVDALTQLISQAVGMTVKLGTLPNFGSGAKVGDYLMVSEVDEEKRMVTVIPADAPSGGKPADLSGYAKERWVQEGFQPKGEYLTKPSKAIVGQFFCVKEVDCNGKVISVEAVDAPAGGGSGVYVGDEDGAVLAEIFINPDDPPTDYIPAPLAATVGQTMVVEEVNENGVPTKWRVSDLPTVPNALPNPHPLTIGDQTYDGSTAVNIKLPSGDSGGGRLLGEITLSEDVNGTIIIPLNDNPFLYGKLLIEMNAQRVDNGDGQYMGTIFGGTKQVRCFHLNTLFSADKTSTVWVMVDLFRDMVHGIATKKSDYMWTTNNQYSFAYEIDETQNASDNMLEISWCSAVSGATFKVWGK